MLSMQSEHDYTSNTHLNNANSTNNASTTSNRNNLYDENDVNDEKPRESVFNSIVKYIIITEFCERIAYYGFAGSLVLFFQMKMNLSNASADVQYSIWSGLSYLTPLLGGYIADVWWGRYTTIVVFCVIYIVGLSLIVLGSLPGENSNDNSSNSSTDKSSMVALLVFPGLYLAALGCGGIKPNVSTLGADQFDDRYESDRKEKESFFNWFYWSVNMGACISYTLIAYLCQYGIPTLGGEPWGFFVGYLVSTIAMAMGLGMFLLGSRRYKLTPHQGSVVAEACAIILQSFRRQMIVWLRALWGIMTVGYSRGESIPAPVHVLDWAKNSFGGSFDPVQVDAVKQVTRLTPFLLAQIPFWGIYSQMSTAFQNQGCQMDLSIGGAPIPVSALNLFDTLAIVMLVPIFDGVLYPFCKKHGYELTMLKKIGLGFIFALLSMLIAAVIEQARLAYAPPAGNYLDESARQRMTPCQSIDEYDPYRYQQYLQGLVASAPAYCSQISGCTTMSANNTLSLECIQCANLPQMSSLNILWQIPQFVIVGFSEILTSITALEFFFSESPSAMRSVAQSFNIATTGLGSLAVVPLIYVVNSNPDNRWVPENVDEGHLIWFFLLLAFLMSIGLAYFWYISTKFVYMSGTRTLLDDNDALEMSSVVLSPVHNISDRMVDISTSSSRDIDSLLPTEKSTSTLLPSRVVGRYELVLTSEQSNEMDDYNEVIL